MITSRIDWFLQSCRRWSADGKGELVLNSDDLDKSDIMRQPTFLSRYHSTSDLGSPGGDSRQPPMTPRQRDIWSRLELPKLEQYPLPPGMTLDDPPDTRHQRLLELYQEFVLEMHTGAYLTQLTSSRDYSDIHCQLMEDLTALKLDQSNGRIIEFPLTGVSKVYRIVKNDDKWCSTSMNKETGMPMSATEHIVVVEFLRRKLAFVFSDTAASQRFLICMELLIRRAQQKQVGKATRTLKPSFPPPDSGPSRPCATPRTVHGQGRCA